VATVTAKEVAVVVGVTEEIVAAVTVAEMAVAAPSILA
jgi:hypothetical protein